MNRNNIIFVSNNLSNQIYITTLWGEETRKQRKEKEQWDHTEYLVRKRVLLQ